MSLKDALANSLLMFVAATCVILIVKAVPPSPPVVANGSGSKSPASTLAASALRDGVVVYYLHSNTRCPTCRTIEAYAQEAVQVGFADELKSGNVVWQVINYETPGNEHFATDYKIAAPNVVLAQFANGQQVKWKSLPEVWEHVGNKAVYFDFIQKNLRDFLGQPLVPSATPQLVRPTAETPPPDLPIPE